MDYKWSILNNLL